MELLRGGSGHSHSISASRLGGLSGQNATVAPIIFALLLNATVAPILSGRPALPLLGVCGHHRSPELINTLAAGRAAHPSPASTRVSDYSLTTPFVFHLWLSFILSCIPTAAAQAALFGPSCLRAACAGAGVCSGPAAQPWSLGGRAAGSFRTGGSVSSRCVLSFLRLSLSFILSCIPTAAAQAALFGPGYRRAACASVGVCSRSSGAAMVAGRAGGWLL